LFGGIVVACLLFAWLRGDPRQERGALTALVASGLAVAVDQVLGFVWDRPRPFVAHPTSVHVLIAHAREGSFPSDHAGAGFANACALYLMHRRLGALALPR
jgi:undecaprenyl-diphosphatase